MPKPEPVAQPTPSELPFITATLDPELVDEYEELQQLSQEGEQALEVVQNNMTHSQQGELKSLEGDVTLKEQPEPASVEHIWGEQLQNTRTQIYDDIEKQVDDFIESFQHSVVTPTLKKRDQLKEEILALNEQIQAIENRTARTIEQEEHRVLQTRQQVMQSLEQRWNDFSTQRQQDLAHALDGLAQTERTMREALAEAEKVFRENSIQAFHSAIRSFEQTIDEARQTVRHYQGLAQSWEQKTMKSREHYVNVVNQEFVKGKESLDDELDAAQTAWERTFKHLANERTQQLQSLHNEVDSVYKLLHQTEDKLDKTLQKARDGLAQVSKTIENNVVQAKNTARQLDPGQHIKTGVKIKPISEWKIKW